MSEPMEDKRLERDDNKLGCGLCYIRDYSANCLIHGDEKRKEILMRAGADEFIQYHHNPIVDQKNKEIATLQSQITALNMKLSMPEGGAVDEFIQYHHNPIVGQMNNEISKLKDQLTTIKELINGASLHPETGVSLVDDVRDLVKELKVRQVFHVNASELVDLKAENTRLREALKGIVSYHPTHAADDDDRHCCRSFNKAEQALTQLQLGRDGV